jgi:hypothetical protein
MLSMDKMVGVKKTTFRCKLLAHVLYCGPCPRDAVLTVPGCEMGHLTSNLAVQHFGACIWLDSNNKVELESSLLFLVNFYG